MPAEIIVLVESEPEFRRLKLLIDRKLKRHAPDWWDDETLECERTFRGVRPGAECACWAKMKEETKPDKSGNTRIAGVFPDFGRGRGFDAAAVRGFLNYCARMRPLPAVALIIRDLDAKHADKRAESIRAAVKDFEEAVTGITVVLGLARIMSEAWVLNGFVARSPYEIERLAQLRRELSFHPVTNSEELDAQDERAKNSAKRALEFLTDGDRNRGDECFTTTDWATLRANGVRSGLTDFLKEVTERLVPLVNS